MSGSLSTAVNKPVDGSLGVVAEKEAVALWTRAIERLRARLSRHTFQTYFEPIKPVSLLAGELTLAHSSKFMIDWVRDNLLDVLLQDLEAQHGSKCTVKFVVRERPGTEPETEPAAATAERTDPSPSVSTTSPGLPGRPPTLNTKYTFDSFVVGPSNQFAVAAC